MRIPKPVVRIVVLAPLFFGLLMLLGTIGFYAPSFRAVANTILHRFGSGRIAHFAEFDDPVGIFDTQVWVGSDSLGTPVYPYKMGISTIREGYAPTALIAALVLATPIPWPRRGRMLLLGLLAAQVFVAFRMIVVCLYGFSKIGLGDRHLLEVGELGQTLLRRANQVISTDLHVSYLVPVLIWVVLVSTMTDFWKQLQPTGAADAR